MRLYASGLLGLLVALSLKQKLTYRKECAFRCAIACIQEHSEPNMHSGYRSRACENTASYALEVNRSLGHVVVVRTRHWP